MGKGGYSLLVLQFYGIQLLDMVGLQFIDGLFAIDTVVSRQFKLSVFGLKFVVLEFMLRNQSGQSLDFTFILGGMVVFDLDFVFMLLLG